MAIIVVLFVSTAISFTKTKDLNKSISILLATLGLSVLLIGSILCNYISYPHANLVYTISMVTFAILVITAAYLSSGAFAGGMRRSLKRFEGKMFFTTITVAVVYAILYISSLIVFSNNPIRELVDSLLLPFHVLMGSLMVTFLLTTYKKTKNIAHIFLLIAFIFYTISFMVTKDDTSLSSALRFMGDLFLLMGIFLFQAESK